MQHYLSRIKRASSIGLWASVGIVILTALALMVSPWRFYQNEHTMRWMLVAATVLTVGIVSITLLTVRRRIPALRQTESLEAKLQGYASHIEGIYWSILAAVTTVCVLAVLSFQGPLLMLAIMTTVVLFLAYPNMYRMKVELGLTDDEMRTLFGDRYISGDEA